MKHFLLLILLLTQATPARSVLGTITAVRLDASEIEVKPDNAPPTIVKISGSSVVQKIAPGETNLRNAATINVSELAIGDRVLVTLAATSADAARIVVMSASDIARRDQAERDDWNRRGVNGIVTAKNGNQIVLKARTLQGELQQTVSISDKTRFRRYAPDSVRFADAVSSRLEDISAGDQLRARGEKSADGLRVQAEEVVFGTFTTRAGSVTMVDTASRQLSVTELGSGKPLTIKLTEDSQIKQMAAPPRGGAAPAINQMIETMPAGKIEDIRPGTSVIVSSTRGSQDDQVTAILVLSNADMLIRLLTAPAGRAGTLTFGTAGAGGIDTLAIGP